MRPTAIPYQTWVALRRKRAQRRGDSRLASMYAVAGPGDLVFDVGANIGDHIELFRSRGARVVAVEPQPKLAADLEERFGDADDVEIEHCALAAEPGTGELQLNSSHVIASMSAGFREATDSTGRFGDAEWTDAIEVETHTMDELIARHGVPRLCKIDVEGYEREVLAGLSQPIEAVVFEFTGEVMDTAIACVERLAHLGSTEFAVIAPEATRLPRRWNDRDGMLAELRGLPPGAYGDLYARVSG